MFVDEKNEFFCRKEEKKNSDEINFKTLRVRSGGKIRALR